MFTRQFELMRRLIPLNIKRHFQRPCQKTLYKDNHSKCPGVARRAWSSHDGSTWYFNLRSFKPDQNPIIGGMGRFLDDGNYAKDIVEGTMFKVRQIMIVGVVKLL